VIVDKVVYPLRIKNVVYILEGVQDFIVVITFENVNETNNSLVELF